MTDAKTELVGSIRDSICSALIALDFDGTLAPIVADPQTSRLCDGAGEVLGALAAAGARIAIVTGREAATAVRLSGLDQIPGLIVEGLYGAERWSRGDLTSPPEPAAIKAVRTELPDVVARALAADSAAGAGVWIEDKRLSLVVHTRRATDPSAALAALQDPVTALGERIGVEVHPGHDVIELRLAGFDKGRALRGIVEELDPSAILYAGDDLGDLPAFRYVSGLRMAGRAAWSAGVVDGARPTPAEITAATDVQVSGPGEIVTLLRDIAAR